MKGWNLCFYHLIMDTFSSYFRAQEKWKFELIMKPNVPWDTWRQNAQFSYVPKGPGAIGRNTENIPFKA